MHACVLVWVAFCHCGTGRLACGGCPSELTHLALFRICAGLASTALVLSIAAPFGGNKWYLLTALSPLSGLYYWQRGTRKEEVQVRDSCHPCLETCALRVLCLRYKLSIAYAAID